jgi:oxalate decarboxylase/phosphoglucose isomerase-like protein (cupin superfamily)
MKSGESKTRKAGIRVVASDFNFAAPTAQFSSDLSNNPYFKKDARNYINMLNITQLNTLGNYSLLDIYLSAGNLVEPHYHQNCSELVYCISGAGYVSMINPFTKKLTHFPVKPGSAVNVPQGWWHYDVATEDNTHFLAIFDAPVAGAIFGSDILRLTPSNVLAYSYCLNDTKLEELLAPLHDTVIISPPADCKPTRDAGASTQSVAATAAYVPTASTANYYGVNTAGYVQQQSQTIGNGWDHPYRKE